MVHPPSTQSVAEMRTNNGKPAGHVCRTACTTSRRIRVRFSTTLRSNPSVYCSTARETHAANSHARRGSRRSFAPASRARFAASPKARTMLRNSCTSSGSGRIDAGENGIALGAKTGLQPLGGFHRSAAIPRRRSAGLASRVRQLHPRHGAMLFDKAKNAREHRDVIVHPHAQILRADASVGKHGCASVITIAAPPTARLPR